MHPQKHLIDYEAIDPAYHTEKGRVSIGWVAAGGTIFSGERAGKVEPIFGPEEFKDVFFPKGSKLRTQYNIDEHTPAEFPVTGYDSTEFGDEQIQSIVLAIYSLLTSSRKRYAGILVTCGTDSMAITAQAAAFALQDLAVPVVFTGAQLHPEHDGSDAVQNFERAVMIAARGKIAEVLIAFDRSVHRAVEADKTDANDLDAFSSPHAEMGTPLLRFDGANVLARSEYRLRKEPTAPPCRAYLEAADLSAPRFPWTARTRLSALESALQSNHGLILEGLAGGNIPSRVDALLRRHAERRKPKKRCFTVVVPQSDTRKPEAYGVLASTEHPGYVFADGMVHITAQTKLLWLFGQAERLGLKGRKRWDFVRSGFQHFNFVGESPVPLSDVSTAEAFLHGRSIT